MMLVSKHSRKQIKKTSDAELVLLALGASGVGVVAVTSRTWYCKDVRHLESCRFAQLTSELKEKSDKQAMGLRRRI